jgi:DNA polymerase-3 subunit gamma/tau
MTLLRMLAFRPAASVSGSGAAPVENESASSKRDKVPERQAGAQVAAQSQAGPGEEGFDWARTVPNLGLKGAALMLASNCAFERREGDAIRFGLDPRSESLLTKERKDAIGKALARYCGERLRIEISVTDDVAETPTQEQVRIADERLDAARASLEADPNVQTLKNMFGAELKPDSIELLNSPQGD